MTEANPETGATDVNGAASRLKTMLLSEQSQPTDTPSETGEAQVDNSQEVAETPSGDTKPADRRFKAKLGDRDVEFELLSDDFDLDEVPKALMMEADYRKKTSEVSKSRKEIEAKKEEVDKYLAELAQSLEYQGNQLDSEEMLELKDSDPEAYWSHVDKVKTRAEQYRDWQQKRNSELQDQHAKAIEAEMSKYSEAVPEWLDESVKQADFSKMGKLLTDTGFSEQEIGGMYDRRMMSLIRKAALYDELKSQNLEANRVIRAPRSASPAAKQTDSDHSRTKAQKTRDRARQTGRVTDAQQAIKQIMNFK